MLVRRILSIVVLLAVGSSWANPNPAQIEIDKGLSKGRYSERLQLIRSQALDIEDALLQNQDIQKQAKQNLKRLQLLIKLRQEERDLGRKRLSELQSTVIELESRRETLNERVRSRQESLRHLLMAIEASLRDGVDRNDDLGSLDASPPPSAGDASESSLRLYTEAPRRKLMANLVTHGLKELEILHVDVEDSEQLSMKIQEEKQQLAYLFQDLDEKESVLELNRQIQSEMLHKSKEDRLTQLENYRKLKSSQAQVEQLIQDFNARRELEKSSQTERMVSKLMEKGAFARLKGRLQLPVVDGKVVSNFGRAFDPKSRLYIFKKGVDIEPPQKSGKTAATVRAVFAGKVAFSGELPDYGQVAIIDHGNHFYSLCAHLGRLSQKAGASVAAGDAIGLTDDLGTPVYFEIRARNVAVNPLQWVSN